MKKTWLDAMRGAIARYTVRHGTREFDRQGLITEELNQIIEETGSRGKTPDQTLSRVLQDLRDSGEITFLDDEGNYRLN